MTPEEKESLFQEFQERLLQESFQNRLKPFVVRCLDEALASPAGSVLMRLKSILDGLVKDNSDIQYAMEAAREASIYLEEFKTIEAAADARSKNKVPIQSWNLKTTIRPLVAYTCVRLAAQQYIEKHNNQGVAAKQLPGCYIIDLREPEFAELLPTGVRVDFHFLTKLKQDRRVKRCTLEYYGKLGWKTSDRRDFAVKLLL